jgi:hypothetical protein
LVFATLETQHASEETFLAKGSTMSDFITSQTAKDPVDHARTTRKHAGETVKNGANAPGLAAVAVGVVALVIGLFALANGYAGVAAIAVAVAVVLMGAGLGWLAFAHRRVRDVEARWHARHPHRPVEPPTS